MMTLYLVEYPSVSIKTQIYANGRQLLTNHLQKTDHKLEYQIRKKKILRNILFTGISENYFFRLELCQQ